MQSIVVGTAGHIDHGKSALVRALTGTDPDRLKEEQARGITIDLGFAHLRGPDVDLAFVDVPGHERFVKNMLAGVGGIDLVVLVVAADESVMPQTREHFHICRLLQVPAGVIALTKSDTADAEMLELARVETQELVAGSFLADAEIVPVSSKTGAGLDDLRAALVRAARTLPARQRDGAVRLPIDRVFSVKGFGTVVTGTLASGVMHDEQEVVVLPRGLPVKVRGLQVHGQRESSVAAGRRLAVNLGGADVSDIQRGDTLAVDGTFEITRRFDALMHALPDARPIRHGSRVRVHHGTVERLGRVAIGGLRRAAGGVTELAPGESAYVRVRLEAPVVLTRGDRFIIRAYSPTVTIGGGTVLDPHPPMTAIRTDAGWKRLLRLDGIDRGPDATDAAVLGFLEERGPAGLPRRAIVSRGGITPVAADEIAARLAGTGRAVALGDWLVAPAAIQELSGRLIGMLQSHHTSEPLSDGLPREEARERVFGRAAPMVFDHVVSDLVARQRIVAKDRLALASHQLSLTPEEGRARDGIERVYREAGLAPPDAQTAQSAANVAPELWDRIVTLLLRQKTLVRIDALMFHADALARLRSDIRGLNVPGASGVKVDVAAFKERYGITRKYAIPLLEYLDRERITRRVGDSRIVL